MKEFFMKKFARGLLLGSLVGAVTGLLTAPKKGKQTQADLKRTADELSGQVAEMAETVSAEVKKQVKQHQPKIDQAKKAIGEAYEAAVQEADRVAAATEAELTAEVKEAGDGPKKKASKRSK
jgi:gas vesicle protein